MFLVFDVMEKFNAESWMTEAGISEKGRKKLTDAEISDEIAIEFVDNNAVIF
jgi:hypothetical protein